MKKTIVINLFGGPGSGKSTTCAGIFERLKLKGINAEMALEYAKDKVWEKSYHTLDNQIYVFGKQLHRIFRLKDDVDIIITDSPLILSIYYDKENNSALRELIMNEYKKFDNINLFIRRGELPYNPKGRYQTENEAKEIDTKLEQLLEELNVDYVDVNKGETDKAVEMIESLIFKT